ncbi:hypothetical protein R3X27_21940 [Tropicimonas sp. TH_r6]|uniref:hypothetical protein n=1 Tax=Tropicimonas sp. TH_r6 TaxID=3082085 RepID=UPI002954A82A|nr:hypothetical protein [Tropicimonas sp. TH_r6]MDV7145355.1 hypothetical protein [Tropicimonas sp. TH_r6]
MALKATIEKLESYRKRLKQKKAEPISRKKAERIVAKLDAKHDALKSELKAAKKPSKQERLKAKLKVVEELQERAAWLVKQIGKQAD